MTLVSPLKKIENKTIKLHISRRKDIIKSRNQLNENVDKNQ